MITNSQSRRKSKILEFLLAAVLILFTCGAVLVAGKLWYISKQIELTGISVPKDGKSTTDPSFIEVKEQLIVGFPKFPVYPGAKLLDSSKVKVSSTASRGYRAHWEIQERRVPEVMQWYIKELKVEGWRIDQSSADPQNYGEQIAKVSKGGTVAYLRIELLEENTIEIEVDMPISNEQ